MPGGDCGRVLHPVGEAQVKQTACLSPKGEFAVCPKQALQGAYEVTQNRKAYAPLQAE